MKKQRKEGRVNNPTIPKIAIGAAVAVLMMPWSVLAQGGFRVSPGTGLELGESNADASTNAKKPKDRPGNETEKKPTEITASKETSFDEKSRTAVFIGDVSVKDSQFDLTCEKLTAYLRKGNPALDKKAPENASEAAAKPDAKPAGAKADGPGGGLERAVAEGNVVIVQEKPDEKGEVTRYVGKAAKVEYNAATGNVTLSGWPQIQQGINNQVATEEGTVMILNRAGALKTIGASKTVISDSSEPPSRGKGGTARTERTGRTDRAGAPESNTTNRTLQFP